MDGDLVDPWQQLQNLKQLYEEQFITVTEYKERKDQIVSKLTGTSPRTKTHVDSSITNGSLHGNDVPPVVVPHPPPHSLAAWDDVPTEKAKRHNFNPRTGKWTSDLIGIKIEGIPFARGGLRVCYYATLLAHVKSPRPILQHKSKIDSLDGDDIAQQTTPEQQLFVAKLSVDPYEDRRTYFADVEVQMWAKLFAHRFNAYNPPKTVDFVNACLVELIERPHSPLCGVEKFIHGAYRKHNNNFGYVSEDERNTPQAFSHFTYEASNHKLLIVDIQGVADLYTDPQMHTADFDEKNLTCKGNLGKRGFEKFLAGHKCNSICVYLKLPPINLKPEQDDIGTMPAQRLMRFQSINIVNISDNPAFPQLHCEVSPLLERKEEYRWCDCCVIL